MDDEGLGEFVVGGKASPRTVARVRIAFGLLGTALCAFGAWHVWTGGRIPGLPLRLAAVGLMLGIAAVFLCNVALARRWRWPLWLAGLALPLLFVVRIVFGA